MKHDDFTLISRRSCLSWRPLCWWTCLKGAQRFKLFRIIYEKKTAAHHQSSVGAYVGRVEREGCSLGCTE
ncbi:hypothetical protein E2C01_016584 [Portunus trituberculatus]|uniref:Uncharacterized protein n=1 Tax=Portunus trituberculatus TaxID=210409 RepID=A0A5B7DR35_PORTR|nr:hypothetical protein [Portunus trituberculatus]